MDLPFGEALQELCVSGRALKPLGICGLAGHEVPQLNWARYAFGLLPAASVVGAVLDLGAAFVLHLLLSRRVSHLNAEIDLVGAVCPLHALHPNSAQCGTGAYSQDSWPDADSNCAK